MPSPPADEDWRGNVRRLVQQSPERLAQRVERLEQQAPSLAVDWCDQPAPAGWERLANVR